VVILPPQGRPLIGNEEVGGDTYTTQTHELAVYPQRAGAIRLPPIGVRFASDGGIGKPPVPRQGATKEMTLTARMPPGAEGLSTVITTPKLTVREAWKPEAGKAKLGAAFTRTVTVRAADVPGMVLPPVRWEAPEGVGVYPAPASVTDSSERGELTGQRVESVTYVCEKPGTYRLPGLTLAWWDSGQKQLRRERLAPRTIEVEAAPQPADSGGPAPARKSYALAWWLGGAVILAGLGLVSWLIRKPLGRWLAGWRAVQADSEAAWFSRVAAACREGDPQRVEQALLAWLDHVPNEGRPRRLSDLTDHSPDPALGAQLAALQERLYGENGSSCDWSAVDLFRRIQHVRRALSRTPPDATTVGELPQLNPGRPQS
jgi:hypothetical protein